MNTTYALVAARTREMGTLRALGFSKVSILTAFVVESTVLAVVGGALGCLIALPANGMTSAGDREFEENHSVNNPRDLRRAGHWGPRRRVVKASHQRRQALEVAVPRNQRDVLFTARHGN